MTHYFITSHFNFCGYKSRNKLTREFLERYPNVIVLEGSYDNNYLFNGEKYKLESAGWATNFMLNIFIRKNWNSIKSLTFIDADIILYDNFFSLVESAHEENEDTAYFLCPYSQVNNREGLGTDLSLLSQIIECDNYSSYFHTGYIYSYNKKMLEKIGVFPESLVIGGFDTVLYYCLLKLVDPFLELLGKIKNRRICDELVNFYNRINGVKFDYLKGRIHTFEHGRMINRRYNSRFELYENINEKIIKDYFEFRNEDG